jgi:hypothetical protein
MPLVEFFVGVDGGLSTKMKKIHNDWRVCLKTSYVEIKFIVEAWWSKEGYYCNCNCGHGRVLHFENKSTCVQQAFAWGKREDSLLYNK